jgi:hypothetical protein
MIDVFDHELIRPEIDLNAIEVLRYFGHVPDTGDEIANGAAADVQREKWTMRGRILPMRSASLSIQEKDG